MRLRCAAMMVAADRAARVQTVKPVSRAPVSKEHVSQAALGLSAVTTAVVERVEPARRASHVRVVLVRSPPVCRHATASLAVTMAAVAHVAHVLEKPHCRVLLQNLILQTQCLEYMH